MTVQRRSDANDGLQAIILDYDGVIADTEPLHLRAMEDALGALGVDLSADQYYQLYLGLDDEAVFRTLAGHRHLSWSEETVARLVADKAARFAALLADTCRTSASAPSSRLLFPGVAARLREWGRAVPLAIASGSLQHEIEQVLAAEDIRETVAAIVAAGDTPRGKPWPDPYRRALELLAGVSARRLEPTRCVAVEDSPWGIEAARGAGLAVVAVATSYAAGRLGDADLVVERFEELDLEGLDRLVRRRPRL